MSPIRLKSVHRIFVIMIAFAPLTSATVLSSTLTGCTKGSNHYNDCEFSEWMAWDCSFCCGTGYLSTRHRELCCKDTFSPPAIKSCYTSCSKFFEVDNQESKTCEDVCPCTSSTVKAMTSSATTSVSSVKTTTDTSPTAKTMTSSATTSVSSVKTTIDTSSTAKTMTPSAKTSVVSVKDISDGAICYESEDDVSRCGSQCEASGSWGNCIRDCVDDLHKEITKIVSASLFVAGVIVGTCGTCFVNFIVRKRKNSVSPNASPKSAENPDEEIPPQPKRPNGHLRSIPERTRSIRSAHQL